ncbi:hypothetical protein [Lysinibacillus xylanilyticus]|uniref:Uncharacterized protein n=1 Tax=Lysinibacillus xylanilyticus TaxID=582475 RepID=A0A2M9Q9X5_9BACI|nr:hypothetical protein [Lysinibacillus xylanilyticus]PJO44883.1 hypothetical protein CWD94_04140 [Lysinibacillus xylanilyticus]
MKDLKHFLNSFAKVNSHEYVVNEYTFDLVTNNSKEVFKEALDKYMKYKEQNQNFKELTNWRNEILSKYDEGYWLGKTPVTFDLQGLSPKEYLIESILEILQEQPYKVNSIEGFGTFLCSVCTEDYFFETTKGIYWLSFNVYD